MSNSENKKAKCYFCGLPCTDEDYCYGCQEFVCSKCDERGMELEFATHSIEEHKEERKMNPNKSKGNMYPFK